MEFGKIALPLMLAAGAMGCKTHDAPHSAVQAVRVETVVSVATKVLTPYSGSALAQTQVDMSFKVGGYVLSIGMTNDTKGRSRSLQAGDHVEKGTILAALRPSDFKAKLAELSGMRNDSSAAYVRAKSDLDRAATLRASGSISEAEFDNIKARYGSAAGSAAAANARVSEANIALTDTQLRAPFDGIILTRAVEEGQLVAPATMAFSVADTKTMRVVFGVPDSVAPGLALDQTVTITTEALPGRVFSGTITKIAVQADTKTRVFDVEATIDNADHAIKVGMVTLVQLDLRAASTGALPAALVPLSAVVRPPDAPDGFAVYVSSANGGTEIVHLRKIVLGELVANRVAVTQGLTMGDRVVVQGATLLADGQRVNIVP